MPTFDPRPIISKDKRFIFGATAGNCSVPCETVPVPVSCGSSPACCCLELLDGEIVAVGNGYVTAPEEITAGQPGDNNCTKYFVKLNGQTPPVWVNDCESVTVTLEPESGCCECNQADIQCGPPTSFRGMFSPANRLWKRKTDPIGGKVKINPKTGKPLVVIDKRELLRRLAIRKSNLRFRKK